MKPRINFIIISLILVSFISLTTALEVDEKVKVQYCELALSGTLVSEWQYQTSEGSEESSVFKSWNPTTEEGIFLNITNQNLILGESSDYEHHWFTGERNFYYEGHPNAGITNLTTINIGLNQNKYLYIKCQYKVGPDPLFLEDSTAYHYSYLSSGFNIRTGIIPNGAEQYGNSLSRAYFQKYPINNKRDLSEKNLFANTEPYQILVSDNLKDKPTSKAKISFYLLKSQGRESFTSDNQMNTYIYYIKNEDPDQDPINYIKPTVRKINITNLDTGETSTDNYGLEIIPGNNYSINVTYNNPFNSPLTNKYSLFTYGSSWAAGGLGRATEIELNNSGVAYTEETIDSGKTKTIFFKYYVPPTQNIWHHMYTRPATRPLAINEWYYDYRTNCESYPYIGFYDITPKLSLKKIDGIVKFVYDIDIELQNPVSNSCANEADINSGDYEFEIRIFNKTLSGNQINFTTHQLEDNIPKSTIVTKNFVIPIQEGWIDGGSARHPFEVYAIPKNAEAIQRGWQGKTIAKTTVDPYFKPGNLIFQGNEWLQFSNKSRVDNEFFAIGNPSEEERNYLVNLTDISSNNFSISFDGNNFDQTKKFVNIYPLQKKEIRFWVKANHKPWIQNQQDERLTFKITGEDFEKDISYNLRLNPTDLEWFNIHPLGFEIRNAAHQDPETIYLKNQSVTEREEITFKLEEIGSTEGIANNKGKSYTVNISLLKNESGALTSLKNISRRLATGDLRKEISFEYDFEYHPNDYILKAIIDTEGSIEERDSTLLSAEEDNFNTYTLPIIITNCFFEPEGSYMYRIDYFGKEYNDTENVCECPPELTYILNSGKCRDPWADCSDFSTRLECNDNPSHENNEMCAWQRTELPKITSDTCTACMNITHTCRGYNNQETCEADPCQKASLYDCGNTGCNRNNDFGCKWDQGRCDFYGNVTSSTGNAKSCNYDIEVIQECDGNHDLMILKYTTTESLCEPEKTAEILCNNELTTLPGFSEFSLLASMLAIAALHLFIKNKRKVGIKKKIPKK